MAKKPKKIDKKDQIIESLKDDLKDKNYFLNRANDEIRELKNDIKANEKIRNAEEGRLNIALSTANDQVRNLMEIIRWHTNPRTTEYPFTPEKSQRNEKNGYNDYGFDPRRGY